jgi:hypothetical protein
VNPVCSYADPEIQTKFKQKCGGGVLFVVRGYFSYDIFLCYQHKRWWTRNIKGCSVCVPKRM